MATEVRIDRRFRGPEQSGNGGYSCGLLAAGLDGEPLEVTLRVPPPLDRPMLVEPTEGGMAMREGDRLIAEGRPAGDLELSVPEPIGLEEAAEARASSHLHHRHPFPGCFVCGPERRPGDGMMVVCGDTGRGSVAAPWEADDTLPTRGGAIAEEIVWAALDCPGGLAGMLMPEVPTSVLGRMTARIHRRILPGQTYVAVGWPIEHEGRKFLAGSAIFSQEGEPLAEARAVWIAPRA